MEKMYSSFLIVIRGVTGETYRQFTDRVWAEAIALSKQDEIGSCKLAVTTGPPPRFSVIPYKKGPVALITLTGSIRKGTEQCREICTGIDGFAGFYRGECVLPVAYEKNWGDLTATPGAGLLTLFTKKADIDYETFIDRWHNGHTPLSLKIHPLWNYVRNVVTETVIEGSEPFDGIVEEHFRTRKDLTGLTRFFGGFGKMAANMIAVYKDTNRFIDTKTIEPYFITEYWISSGN